MCVIIPIFQYSTIDFIPLFHFTIPFHQKKKKSPWELFFSHAQALNRLSNTICRLEVRAGNDGYGIHLVTFSEAWLKRMELMKLPGAAGLKFASYTSVTVIHTEKLIHVCNFHLHETPLCVA